MSTDIYEAHEAFQRASAHVRHAVNVETCRLLHDVGVQQDALRQMRLEAERSGVLSEALEAQFRALEADLDALRAKLEVS